MIRAVKEAQPKMFIFEMVDGFLRDKFATHRRDMVDRFVALGYHVSIHSDNAMYKNLAQNRSRCFLIGHSCPGQVRRPEDTNSFVTVGQALGDLGPPYRSVRSTTIGCVTMI